MNGIHDIGEKGVVIGAATAFSCKTGGRGILFQDVQGNMPDNSHILSGMVFADTTMVLAECHIQTPVEGIFNSPVFAYRFGKQSWDGIPFSKVMCNDSLNHVSLTRQ